VGDGGFVRRKQHCPSHSSEEGRMKTMEDW
jgi:hypothetical protein